MTVKSKRVLLVIVACGLCWGHEVKSQPAPTNIAGAQFPRVDSDLSVPFRVHADQAQEVQLSMELGQSAYDMVMGPGGPWEVTAKPLLSSFHLT